MKLVKQTCLYSLLAVLLVVAAVIFKTYRDTEQVIEYLVSQFTDYELHIDRSVAVQFVDGWASVLLLDSRLDSKRGEPLLKAERISARLKLSDLGASQIVLHDMRASNLQVFVERMPEGHVNWQPLNVSSASQKPKDTKAGEEDWQLRLGRIDVESASVTITGLADEVQALTFETIQLNGFDDERQLAIKGLWNNYPISVEGTLNNALRSLSSDQAMGLDATLMLAGITATANGDVAATGSDVNVTLSTSNFGLLSRVTRLDLPELGRIDFKTRVQIDEQAWSLRDLLLDVAGSDLKLKVAGQAEQHDERYRFNLSWAVKADNIGELDINGELAHLEGWRVDAKGVLGYDDIAATLESVHVELANPAHHFEIQLPSGSFKQRDWQQFDLGLDGSALAYRLTEEGQTWEYRYPADALQVHVTADGGAKVSTTGFYKEMPLSLTGEWGESGDYWLKGVVDGADARVDGYLKNGEFNIVGKVQTPTLSPLSKLLGRPLIEVNRAEVLIDVLVDAERASMRQLDVLLRKDNARVAVKGHIDDFYQVDDYRFDVTISAGSIDQFDRWMSAHDRAIETTVSAFTDTCTLASSGDEAACKNMVVPMSWLSDTAELLSIREWLDLTPGVDAHLLADFSVLEESAKLSVTMPEITLKSDQLNIQWKGELKEHPVEEGKLVLGAGLVAKLTEGLNPELKTFLNLDTQVQFESDGPIVLKDLKLSAGETKLAADLELMVDEGLRSVKGDMQFSTLDLRPYMPELKEEDDVKPIQAASDNSFFPDTPFKFDWIPEHEINLLVSIGHLATPGFTLDKLSARIVRTPDRFAVESLSALFGPSPFRASFAVADLNAEPELSVFFEGRQLPAGENRVFFDFNLMKAGNVDAILDLKGRGDSLKSLLSNLDGRVSLVARNATMNGRGLDNVAPEILTELNQRLNPFSRKRREDTELECGVIHFDIAKGIASADKSIVLVTPNINFAAHGAIDLKKEQLRMQVVPRTRKGLGLSLRGTFAKMAVVSGSLSDPGIEFDPTGAITSGSIDVAGTVLYGPLYWLYLGQAQKILASSKVCDRVIRTHVPEFDSEKTEPGVFDTILPTTWRSKAESWIPL